MEIMQPNNVVLTETGKNVHVFQKWQIRRFIYGFIFKHIFVFQNE